MIDMIDLNDFRKDLSKRIVNENVYQVRFKFALYGFKDNVS